MANQWFRMYAEFASDPKVQMLSETDQRRYIMVLCIRCNGDVTLQDEEVAFQLRISNEEWLKTKSVLVGKGLVDGDNKPTAWDRRQFSSDSSAARVSKHREAKKQACNVTVTPQNRTEQIQNKEENTIVASASPLAQCPHQKILALYAEELPELPQPRIWEGTRQDHLKERWRWVLSDLKKKGKAHDAEAGLEFFSRMFAYISKIDFLMGRSGDWSASLPWIVEAENFAKIIEGNYENKVAA